MSVVITTCLRCGQPLPGEHFTSGDFTPCPHCGTAQYHVLFPAIGRPIRETRAPAAGDTEHATCFYHQHLQANDACAHCGRFVCSHCAQQPDERTLCPRCIEQGMLASGPAEQVPADLQSRYNRNDRLALLLSPLSLMPVVGLVIAPAVWYFGVRWLLNPERRNNPRRPSPALALLALLLSAGGLLGTIAFVSAMITAAGG